MNKRFLIVSLVLLMTLALAIVPASAAKKKGAMFAPGTILVGGDLDFRLAGGSTTIEPDEGDDIDSDQFYFDLGVMGGYYVIRGLEIGPWVNFSYESDEDDDETTKDTEWTIGGQIGYFYPLMNAVSVFAMGGIGYAKTTSVTEPEAKNAKDTETTFGGFIIEPRGGIMYSINRNLALDAALYFRYSSGSGTQDDGNNDNDFDVKLSEYGLRAGLFGFF